jgi:suppressor of ftsI
MCAALACSAVHANPATAAAQAVDCPDADPVAGVPSPDLYCIALLPAAGVDAMGSARLLPVSSPFGVAVTADGAHLYDVAFTVRGLPPPSSLGPYTTFVAWATTPQLAPTVKLGVVGNGETLGGRVSFDRFFVLITAESSADVRERTGPPVLRGTSAAVRMQPHDFAFVLAGMLEQPDSAAAHAHAHAADSTGWTPPPMHPDVAMPPALMTLRPDATPYLPSADDAPLARPRALLRLADGDTLDLVAGYVRKRILGRAVTMVGFNGQIPGPLIEVAQAAEIHIRFANRTDLPTAIHWHGIRLDNRFDGVPHVTQEPVPPGGTFDYTVRFPDAGLYWYHPHHREDVLQDLGLYGNLLVRAREPAFFGPAHREEFLILDDLLAGADGALVPYGEETPTHALMGRFGNVPLVNGEPRWDAAVAHGEVVRLYLTNVSSTRVWNLSFGAGARMKVVASDLGRYEREAWTDNVVIAPAERYIVDVRFDRPGDVALVNRVRAIDHIMARFFDEVDTLGVVRVGTQPAAPDYVTAFETLRDNAAVAADIDRYRAHFDRPPDHTLLLTLEPGDLPFPLLPLLRYESVYRHPVEWAGTMPEMDWLATGRQLRWILRDPATGRENMDIDWRFDVGDVVRLRIANDRAAPHAMQHPIHIHGQRFLVLSVNGVPNQHLVWKDTVLLPTGFSAELLLEITNPGDWMLHCHIAEHIEAGMRMVFRVQ